MFGGREGRMAVRQAKEGVGQAKEVSALTLLLSPAVLHRVSPICASSSECNPEQRGIGDVDRPALHPVLLRRG